MNNEHLALLTALSCFENATSQEKTIIIEAIQEEKILVRVILRHARKSNQYQLNEYSKLNMHWNLYLTRHSKPITINFHIQNHQFY